MRYAQKSIGSIVAENYKAAAVFDKYRLDFCCGGKNLLGEACNQRQVNIEEVEADLRQLTKTSDPAKAFQQMDNRSLISYILLQHHFYIRQYGPAILQHLEKVAYKHGASFPYMIRVAAVFSALMKDLLQHMRKEEEVLFPAIQSLELPGSNNAGNIQSPIRVMEQEHDEAGILLEEIRALTNHYSIPGQACTTFRISLKELEEFEARMHEHVHLENNILFPRALDMMMSA